MHMRMWAVLVIAGLATPAFAKPCADQLAAYDKWIAPIKADVAKGAVSSDHVEQLFAIPLRDGSPPEQLAMTLVVDNEGLHDAAGPARPASSAAALIAANINLAFARTHKNAIAHGIIVFAKLDAPAASVRAAVTAAVAAHEKVWLVFRSSDGKAAAPAASSVTGELEKLDPHDISGLVTVIRREFGTCDGLMDMMTKLSGQTENTRLATLVDAPRVALEKCACKLQPDVVATILWKLTFGNLGVLVPVPDTAIAGLPWGDKKGSWKDVADGVVKSLTK